METALRIPKTLMEVYQGLPEGTQCQLIDNQLIMSPSPSEVHQRVLDKLYRRLGDFVEDNSLGVTRVAPYDVYLDEANIYQPDIVYISNDNRVSIRANGFYGVPDMIVEILSPSTSRYDLNDKKKVYQQFGVTEYWVIEPETKQVTGYLLSSGEYILQKPVTGMVVSKLLNGQFIF